MSFPRREQGGVKVNYLGSPYPPPPLKAGKRFDHSELDSIDWTEGKHVQHNGIVAAGRGSARHSCTDDCYPLNPSFSPLASGLRSIRPPGAS